MNINKRAIGPDWLAVDWGTSHLRIWLLNAQGHILAEACDDSGMAALSSDQFYARFTRLAAPFLSQDKVIPVVACGMIGAKQGWHEAPYIAAPCSAPGLEDAQKIETRDERFSLYILPGVKQARPADVMRGEETQIAGFLNQNPSFDGVLCLPGTHTKWVRISAEEIVSFQTFMTGEMFSLLGQTSVLKHSIASSGWHKSAFLEALDAAISAPASIALKLFGLRAETLLNNLSGAVARSRLSGFLIGLELSAARPYWLGQDIAIIGAEELSMAYIDGLISQGVQPQSYRSVDMTLAGLTKAYQQIQGSINAT